ncbi:Ig-like domain-containing protein [Flavobacterium sp. JLP]|nr:Ig-like domain-containing protein [Flavobacterium sp. JLP]
MIDAGNGWYSYTFTNVTSTNLIFNDGTNQTADLSRNKTGWYMNNTWYDSNPGTGVVAVTSVTLAPTTATLSVGATQQLTPTVNPSTATNKSVTYSSNNTAVATVNTSGLITAVASGAATITVTTQDGAKTATCAITVSSSTGTYFTIKNRWTGAYLSDAGTNVGYGATVSGNSYKWQKIAIDATYFVLKNVATGELINIEGQTGSVQCNITDTTFWSAQWSSDYIDGTWVRLRNRWQSGNIIHVENQTGSAQYGNSQDGWFSAQWQLEPTTIGTGKASIKIDDVSETEKVIGIYPNPATDNEFHVLLPELQNGDAASITVSDMNGRTVLTDKLSASGQINHHLASGMYIVNIASKDFNVTKKLIVK